MRRELVPASVPFQSGQELVLRRQQLRPVANVRSQGNSREPAVRSGHVKRPGASERGQQIFLDLETERLLHFLFIVFDVTGTSTLGGYGENELIRFGGVQGPGSGHQRVRRQMRELL